MHRPTGRLSRRSAVACAALMAALVAAAPAGASGGGYRQINLVSDQPGHARVLDRHLVNAWGLANGPGTPFWVANNGTSTSTLYSGAIHGAPAAIVPLVVHIAGGGDPTGQVFNPTEGFKVNVSGTPTASRFIFDSETGKITAWAPGTTRAVVAASSAGAIFKGLTMASVPGRGALLYAADFHNNRIDVFNSSFAHTTTAWHFTDPHLPAGYAPFNVQNIGGWLYVSYAKQDADAEDEIDGPGLGAVDVYTPSGRLVRRLATGGVLNAPWGLVRAPSTFGGSPATSWSATSVTGASTRSTPPATCRARCAGHLARRSRSTACGACASATAPSAVPGAWCSAPAPAARRTGCSA